MASVMAFRPERAVEKAVNMGKLLRL
jgi:hypothetical protein